MAQTHESIRNHFVEEAYEVCEGIDKKDSALLCEELGDVLFQVLFHTDIATQEGAFGLEDVLRGICRKMISRHPTLFGEESESGGGDDQNWEEIKRKEKGEKDLKDALRRVSSSLPALTRAKKFIQKGASPVPAKDLRDERAKAGAALYQTVLSLTEKGIDPEEALNRYLAEIVINCTKYK